MKQLEHSILLTAERGPWAANDIDIDIILTTECTKLSKQRHRCFVTTDTIISWNKLEQIMPFLVLIDFGLIFFA